MKSALNIAFSSLLFSFDSSRGYKFYFLSKDVNLNNNIDWYRTIQVLGDEGEGYKIYCRIKEWHGKRW